MSAKLARRLALAAVLLVVAHPAAAVQRRAFATSIAGSGDLSTWPGSGGQDGLAGADLICRARAAAAALPNANAYRAWLSSPTTDAFCHVQGLSGKRSPGCAGGPPLPAGPWYLENGTTPFAGSLQELTDPTGRIFRAMVRDELGASIPGSSPVNYWTGTDTLGAYYPDLTCDGWTSGDAADLAIAGVATGSSQLWTLTSASPCSSAFRLLCLEPGISEQPGSAWTGRGSIVFVTSLTNHGDLSNWPDTDLTGLAAGDEVCRNLAAQAHLPAPASFVAWLSTSTVDAADRVTSAGPFRRVDGYTVASSRTDLLDGSTDNSLHVDERGRYLIGGGGSQVFTGSLADGAGSGFDCDDWTNAALAEEVTVGVAALAYGPDWTEYSETSCSYALRLYCVSNAMTLFWDGFDYGGDASRWTTVVP